MALRGSSRALRTASEGTEPTVCIILQPEGRVASSLGGPTPVTRGPSAGLSYVHKMDVSSPAFFLCYFVIAVFTQGRF